MHFLKFLFIFLCLEFYTKAEEDKLNDILIFESLVDAYPESPSLFYSLGKSYYDIHAWKQAAFAFQKTLKLEPKNPDAELLLAYALLFQGEEGIKKAKALFQKVLIQVPDYDDAKQGLAKIVKEPKQDPEKKVKKKKEIDYEAVLLERAANLSKEKNYLGAIEIYSYLSAQFPKNSEYLFFLGREYTRAGCAYFATEFFEKSLIINENNSDSLIFLGKYYLSEKNLWIARDLFSRAIQSASNDAAGYIGLARVEAFLENEASALKLFETAYFLEPENEDVIVPFASFLLNQHKYREAETMYRLLSDNLSDDETYRSKIFDTSAYTSPTFFAKASTAQEREKDLFTSKWDASLRYYNTEIGGIYPIDDSLRFTSRIRAGTTRQRLLQSKKNQFDVKAVGGGLKAEWLFDPDWTLIADMSMEWIANNHKHVLLPTKRGVKVEPTLMFRYNKDLDSVTFGETSDSIIFRDFAKNHVRVVTRDAGMIYYQRDFEDYRYFGMSASWLWYQDRIHNQEQDASLWFQAGFPTIEDLLSARYQAEYRHFYHETTGYYSFQYQLTHWLKLRSTKKWLSGAHLEMEYWHGWRTTKGKNPQQQIIIDPVDAIVAVTTVENQIDWFFITLGYMPDDYIDLTLGGFYYHDSFDYTVISAKFQLDWRF